MSKTTFRKLAKALIVLSLVIVVLLVVGPFLIPVSPLDDLVSAQQAASGDSQFVTIPFEGTDGIELHYVGEGTKPDEDEPTFVLLHGAMFNAYNWNEVMDFFGDRGHVVAYDQTPYGLSEKLVAGDWSERNPYTTDAAVDQLFAFMDALDVDDAVLVGSSFGGTLAAQAALADPERVKALILVDAAVYVQEEMPAWLMDVPQVRRLGPLFARWLGQDEGFVRKAYLYPDRLTDDRMALTSAHTQVEDWDLALWEYLRAWGAEPPTVADHIADIGQPALVIAGDSDAVVPVTDSVRLDAELPNSELAILPSCGHLPHDECPDAFEEAVDAWLGRNG